MGRGNLEIQIKDNVLSSLENQSNLDQKKLKSRNVLNELIYTNLLHVKAFVTSTL